MFKEKGYFCGNQFITTSGNEAKEHTLILIIKQSQYSKSNDFYMNHYTELHLKFMNAQFGSISSKSLRTT